MSQKIAKKLRRETKTPAFQGSEPFLYFSLILTKKEADFLLNYELMREVGFHNGIQLTSTSIHTESSKLVGLKGFGKSKFIEEVSNEPMSSEIPGNINMGFIDKL